VPQSPEKSTLGVVTDSSGAAASWVNAAASLRMSRLDSAETPSLATASSVPSGSHTSSTGLRLPRGRPT
jgi:hypothetical protein